MITVEMSAQYLSLAILVDAIASAVERAERGDGKVSDTAAAAASVEWESRLRDLADAQAIPGHDFETLAAQPWYLLDIERDVFWVEDLNRCAELVNAGLEFKVAQDQDRAGNAAFVAAFAEETYNGRQISWRYWVGQMPSLTGPQACRLLAGLDPDLYEDISARPVPRNNVDDVCRKVVMLERLATAERKTSDSAAGWLAWARKHKFTTHVGFALAVAEFGIQETASTPSDDVVYTLASYPKLEAKTEWTGSRLAGADYFNLEDAAELASRHARCAVSVKDFLRAGGRGEISIHAVCRRAVAMAPTRATDSELVIQPGSYPTLPMAACKSLALFGQAEWRYCEGWMHHDDFDALCSFVRWRLAEAEASISTVVADCLVTGWHVHALADAMKLEASPSSAATDEHLPASSDPATNPDRGRRLKRAALISDNVRRWPSVERDLQDASTNGLSAAAKATDVGWWWEGSALDWARARGKVTEIAPALAAIPGRVHRLLG